MSHFLLCPLPSTASRSAVSGHSYPIPHPASWEQCGQGRCKTTQDRQLSLCHEVVRVLWSGRWGMAIVPAGPSAWPLQTLVLSLSSCKQLLVAPSTSAFKHRSSSQDTSGVHRLWIYCPQFYSMVLTASFITGEKKKIPALPGALSHVFLPADTTHFSVLIPDLSGGGRATLGDHCPRCWKDNGLVSRQPVSSLALPPP